MKIFNLIFKLILSSSLYYPHDIYINKYIPYIIIININLKVLIIITLLIINIYFFYKYIYKYVIQLLYA